MTLDDPLVVAGLAGLLGLAVGSFLNVCSFRWPEGESVVRPGSRCPRCERPIRWFDNVPVLGWLLLGGRCRECSARISVQYPLVELATGAIWAGLFLHHGLEVEALRGSLFLTILLGISLTDARFYLIPDEFSVGGATLGLILAPFAGGPSLTRAALGAAVGFGLLWAVARAGKVLFPGAMERAGVDEAMGGGDIKMMALVGAFLGPAGVFLTVFLGSLVGLVIFGPISLLTRKLIPFGVFLAAGAGVTYGWGDLLVAWYVGTFLGL